MLTGNTPILVLKEGTKREKGRGALANNIAATQNDFFMTNDSPYESWRRRSV